VSRATQRLYSGSEDKVQIIDSFDPNRPVATVHGTQTGRSFSVQSLPIGDVFTVAQLLDVAGIDPDAIFPDPNGGAGNASVRYDGQTLRVRVVYKGDHTAWHQNATYAYYVGVNDLESKISWTDESSAPLYMAMPLERLDNATNTTVTSWVLQLNGTNLTRTQYDLHGLQLLFSQEATLHVFDLPTLFLSLLSGAGLLFVAKVAADTFLLYLAPKRADYRLFVEAITPDFSPDSEGEKAVLQKVLARKRESRARIEHGRVTSSEADPATHATQPLAAADAMGSLSHGSDPIVQPLQVVQERTAATQADPAV